MDLQNIQKWFQAGQIAYMQGQFDQAYKAFERCVQTMPNLVEAWENMATSLAANGVKKSEITHQLMQHVLMEQVSKEIQERLRQRIADLQVALPVEVGFLQLAQQMKVNEALQSFASTRNQAPDTITDEIAIAFLHHLFMAHESLAKQQGRMRLEEMLNSWVNQPDISYCLQVTTRESQRLIALNAQNPKYEPQSIDFLLFETLALVHYTYGDYSKASIAFQWLMLKSPFDKQDGYRKHLATCYSLDGKYAESLMLDPTNTIGWERYKPCDKMGFKAQALKMMESAKSIGRLALTYWPAGMIAFQDSDITIAQLDDVMICGQDPMVFDEQFVYAGNRGNYRHCPPQPLGETLDEGIVIFATNSNNHYHMLIEFMAKLLSGILQLPKEVPILISTTDLRRHQSILDLMGFDLIGRKVIVQAFGVEQSVSVKKLWVLDTTTPGHASKLPANLWDCYLASPASVRHLSQAIWRGLEEHRKVTNLRESLAQDHFIYVRRLFGVRSVEDPQNLLEPGLEKWASDAGLVFVCFDGLQDFVSQVALFGRAKVIFGPHGAGLTNAIFAKSGAMVWEMPLHYQSNTLFLELCAMVGIEHRFSQVDCDYLGKIVMDEDLMETLHREWCQIAEKIKESAE